MARHLAGVAEIVDDVNAALAFYRDTLGFQVKDQMGDDYAVVIVPGILHFGIWNRGHAALATYGTRDAADRIPLGFTLEFEVDDVDTAAKTVAQAGLEVVQPPHMEPWGQKTTRAVALGGGLLGFAETPWGRTITQQVEAS